MHSHDSHDLRNIINVDKNNIVTENCAPYNVTLERDDILGIVEIEGEEMDPELINVKSLEFTKHKLFCKNIR
jgi:hypothetical protein